MDTSFYQDVLKRRRTQIYKYTHEHTCWSLGVDQEQFGRRQPRLPQIMYIKHWFVLAIILDGKHYCWGVLCILSLLSKDHLSQQMRKKHYTTRRRKYKLHQTHWAFSLALLPAFMNPNFMYPGWFVLSTCFEAFMGAGLFPASHLCFRSISENKASTSKWTWLMSGAVSFKHCLKVFWELLHLFKYRNNYAYMLENNNNNNVALHYMVLWAPLD